MSVRPIRGDELGVFACFSEKEEINNHLAQYLADLRATGTSRPGWCFVTEDAGQIRGRVVYWALPACPVPALIDFLDVPWRGDYWAVGEQVKLLPIPDGGRTRVGGKRVRSLSCLEVGWWLGAHALGTNRCYNVCTMTRVLYDLAQEGYTVDEDVIAGLSP